MATYLKYPGCLPRPLYRSAASRRNMIPRRLRTQARIIGIVLAGGKSSRMGRDKALLPVSGSHTDILGRTVALLQDVCGRAIVVGRQTPGYACVLDIAPDCGPVGGVATALDYCQGAACLVLSCDMPFMGKEALYKLVEHRRKRPPGTHVTAYRHADSGKIESLAAIYEPECLPYFQICVNERLLKINRVVPTYHYHFLEYGEAEAQAFFNLNSPADYEKACGMRQMAGE